MKVEALTYAELTAGVPCRGCGVSWTTPITTAAVRARDERRYAKQHGDCKAARQQLADGPMHCVQCCPAPPFDDVSTERIVSIVASARAWLDQ